MTNPNAVTRVQAPVAPTAEKRPPATPEERAFRGVLAQTMPALAQVLPRHIPAENVAALALTAAVETPEIFRCTEASIVRALMKVGRQGLVIGETVHLIPRQVRRQVDGEWRSVWELEAQRNYRGDISVATAPGSKVKRIYAEVVREGDYFDYVFGLAPRLEHVPRAKYDAPLTHVYAVAYLVGGDTQFIVMARDEVEAIRDRYAKGWNPDKPEKSPWGTAPAEMWKKTAIHRVVKQLPINYLPPAARALAAENDAGEEIPEAEWTAASGPRAPRIATPAEQPGQEQRDPVDVPNARTLGHDDGAYGDDVPQGSAPGEPVEPAASEPAEATDEPPADDLEARDALMARVLELLENPAIPEARRAKVTERLGATPTVRQLQLAIDVLETDIAAASGELPLGGPKGGAARRGRTGTAGGAMDAEHRKSA